MIVFLPDACSEIRLQAHDKKLQRGDFMPFFYTEADYENSIIELFRNMGYRHVYAPDLERDFHSPLYEAELNSALHRLNPAMPGMAFPMRSIS